jgi:hypothetical protein
MQIDLKNKVVVVSVFLVVAVLGLLVQAGYAFQPPPPPPGTFMTVGAPLGTVTVQDCTWLNLQPPFVGGVTLTTDGVNLASVVMVKATGIANGVYTVWAGYNATALLRREHPTTCNFQGAWNQIGSITITNGEGLTAIFSPLPNGGNNIVIAINAPTGPTLYSTWLLNFTMFHPFPP